MSTIGYTYGSEWHLLRFLGYHRDELDRHVEEAIGIPGTKVVRWLPFRYETALPLVERRPLEVFVGPNTGEERHPPRILDLEHQGIRFLKSYDQAEYERLYPHWRVYWPQTGRQQTWDAIGQVNVDRVNHWLLVEAKSYVREISQGKCRASGRSRERISSAFTATAGRMGITIDPEFWMGSYYQFANRLAVPNFLSRKDIDIPAKLLFIYFFGDRFREGRGNECPSDKEEWGPHLDPKQSL